MQEITEICDKLGDNIYETSCLAKCFYKTFESNLKNKDDSMYLLPLAEIICKKCDLMLETHQHIEDKLYRKILSKS